VPSTHPNDLENEFDTLNLPLVPAMRPLIGGFCKHQIYLLKLPSTL